jgi:hypothetical protein
MALQHLRRSVFVVAGVLALSLLAYLFVFMAAHMGDMHTKTLESQSYNSVVLPPVETEGPAGPISAPAEDPINEVQTASSVTLRKLTQLIQTIGVVSSITLVVLMLQGVSVAGGAGVVGVEKAVTACTWAVVVALVALPLGRIMPGVWWSGVFVQFDQMLESSELYRSGGSGAPGTLTFWGVHAGLPALLLVGVAAAALRFHSGIESGVLVTHASQLDEKLEKEIRQMKLGELAQPRAVGALHKAIGDEAAPGEPVSEDPPSPMAGGAPPRPI